MESLVRIAVITIVVSTLYFDHIQAASAIGDICGSTSDCSATNSVCDDDGANGVVQVKRCRCNYGYVLISNGNCVAIIHDDIDSNCQTCETNGGTCYDSDGDDQKDGCVCPSYTSGANCGTSHVSVTCDATTFTMTVCYTKHSSYSGTIVLLASGKGTDMACVGFIAGSADTCTSGQYELSLPLANNKLDRCGTKEMLADIATKKYQNTILIQTGPEDHSVSDVSFRTSCSFDTHANARFEPVGLAVPNADERGVHQKPTLAMQVENHLGSTIADGVALRLGDKIRFKILLTDDGTYTAIKMIRCIASSRPVISDPNAVTLPLVLSSCPASGQSHFTSANNWDKISSNVNQLQTGLVQMFKLSEGRSVHIHCTVKLCLKGSESQCATASCGGSGRRKRSTDIITDSSATISRSLQWYTDADANLTKDSDKYTMLSAGSFGAIVGTMGLVLILFVAMVASLVVKLRRSQEEPLFQNMPSNA